ncbi:MAG: AAA family ATPase, partial [Chloroflexi bacterium]|nr:AAA family ATPase [Chloroflexota bacterium]
TRAHLLSIFWIDLDRASAQQTLRTTLHGLRKALGDSLIVDDDKLSLATDSQIDVRALEANYQLLITNPQSLISNLYLYTGDFLESFSLPDSPAFDDWVTVQREHYRRLAVRGFTALAKQHEAEKNYREAIDALSRALAFDPLQEDLQRDCIRLQYLAGDRAGAIRRYDSFRKLLDEEMGVPPMAETRKLYDSIIKDDSEIPNPKNPKSQTSKKQTPNSKELSAIRIPKSAIEKSLTTQLPNHLTTQPPNRPTTQPSNNPTTLPFTGRAAELQQLQEAEPRRLILIEGEAGIGKTRLVEEFIRGSNSLALIGGARELESSLPYQPIIEALRTLPATSCDTLSSSIPLIWREEISRIVPEIFPGAPQRGVTPADESRLWESVNQLLIALAKQNPILLFIDDLHWADQSTLALIGYLTRQTSAPIRLIAATRAAASRSALGVLIQSLTRENRLIRIMPARLLSDEVRQVAQRLSPKFTHPLAAWLTRLSEGNPYILAELVREARQQKILQFNGVLNLDALSRNLVPQTIYSLIAARLARLSDSARRVLDAAVAVGREFDFEIVARAAALSETAALDALDELRAATFVRPRADDSTGRLYIFDHTLSMEVAYREVGEMRHRLLHRRVAESLEAIHGDRIDSFAGLIASHFIEGNAPDRAAPYCLRAAQHAASLAAWKEAITFYECALQTITDKRKQIEIYLALGNAQFTGGSAAQASESFRVALTSAQSLEDAARASAARQMLGQALLLQGRYAEAIALAQPSDSVESEMLWGIALSLEGADLIGADEHLQKAEALHASADRAPRSTLAQIRFERGSVAAQQGDLTRAVEIYKNALATAEESDEAWAQQILALNNIAYHLHLLNDSSASDYAARGLKLARERGALFQQTYLLSTSGEIALAQNDLDRAQKFFDEGLLMAEQFSIPERIAGLTANLGLVAAKRGETSVAIHRLSTALARADSLHTHHLAAQIRLWLVPLLPRDEARLRLNEAKAIAESGGRKKLLEEIEELENPKSQ